MRIKHAQMAQRITDSGGLLIALLLTGILPVSLAPFRGILANTSYELTGIEPPPEYADAIAAASAAEEQESSGTASD